MSSVMVGKIETDPSTEIEKFFNFITEGQEDKPFYVTLLKRTKYLTKEERSKYSNSSNMLDIKLYQRKKYSEGFEGYHKNILRFKGAKEAYLGKDSSPLPEKSKAIYGGVNPVDLSYARKAFNDELNTLEYRANHNKEELEKIYSRIPRLFLKSCTKARLVKNVVDIDVDIDQDLISDEERLKGFQKFLSLLNTTIDQSFLNDIFIVFTKGGFHILSKTKNFNRYWRTETIVQLAAEAFEGFTKEVKENKNEMCPIPGTKQCGFLVLGRTLQELLGKEDAIL